MFAVVLVHPEIPPNTGNVIRLTANTATDLHLVEPLGFRMDDRDLKRAGLDYHEYARVAVHGDWAACRAALEREKDPHACGLIGQFGRCAAPRGGAGTLGRPFGATWTRRYFALTTKATRSLYDAQFVPGDVFVFGRETTGLPAPILAEFAPEHRLAIPMRPGVRSLNLSNAVAVTVYEAWRQQRFALAD
jgi:tRNA (cytidine/uridine-2'-O-)-methyltransferase